MSDTPATPAAGATAAPATPVSATTIPTAAPGGVDAAMAKLAEIRAAEGTTPAPISAPAPAPAAPAAKPVEAPTASTIQAFIDAQSKAQGETRTEKAARTAAEARATAAEAKLAAYAERLRKNPNEVLAEHGWDAERYIEASISGQTPEAVKRAQLESEFKAMKDELTAYKAEQATATHNRALSDYKSQLAAEFQTPAMATEFAYSLAYMDSPAQLADLVWAEMDRTHRSSGGTQQLSAYDAATAIESTLRAKAKRLPGAAVVTPEPVKPSPILVSPSPTPTTITNGLTATTSAPPTAWDPNEPDDARFQRAAAKLKEAPKTSSH